MPRKINGKQIVAATARCHAMPYINVYIRLHTELRNLYDIY